MTSRLADAGQHYMFCDDAWISLSTLAKQNSSYGRYLEKVSTIVLLSGLSKCQYMVVYFSDIQRQRNHPQVPWMRTRNTRMKCSQIAQVQCFQQER